MTKPAAILCVLVACSDGGERSLAIDARFTITQLDGNGPSVLDPLNGQLVTIALTLDAFEVFHAPSAGCRATILAQQDPRRTAGGPQAALVQTEILDKIPSWEVRLELCEASGSARIRIDASINELNTAIGCASIPASAQVRDPGGEPLLTTFTGGSCSATILDVVQNRVLGASDFTVDFDTGGARLP